MTDGYSQPDKGSGFSPSDHPEWENKLFLIWPETLENVVFVRQDGTPDPTDIVTADVAIIDLQDPLTGKPVFIKGARIGGKALTPMIKHRLGEKVLGIFTKLPKQPGKNAAYNLDFPEKTRPQWQQMCQMAQAYELTNPRHGFSQPSSNGSHATATNAETAAWSPNPAPAQSAWGAAPTTTPP